MAKEPSKRPKKAAKKSAAIPSIEFPIIPKLTLSMPLDEKRIKAIQKCIEKGTLNITVNKIDLKTGRVGDPWLYD